MSEDVLDESVLSESTGIRLQPIKDRAMFARVMMIITLVVLLISIGVDFYATQVIADFTAGTASLDDLDQSDNLTTMTSVLFLLVFILNVIAWCRWKYRATSNLKLAELRGLEISPGWSVGWYFIPLANLWMPFRSMSEIIKGSQAIKQPEGKAAWKSKFSAGPAVLWWTLWIVALIILSVSNNMYERSLENYDLPGASDALYLGIVGEALRIGSGIFALILIRKVTQLQSTPPESTSDSLDG